MSIQRVVPVLLAAALAAPTIVPLLPHAAGVEEDDPPASQREPAALKAAVEHPWTDVVLARINPRHRRMDEDATVEHTADLLRAARAAGKGVLGMKLFGCGDLTEPEAREESLRYAYDDGLIHAGTIGFTSPEQIDDAMDRIDRVLA